jgi:hypothetical protein
MPDSPTIEDVVLRAARADDAAGLRRLVELEGALPLADPVLVAERNGAIVAALSPSTGRAVADPFVPALHLVELLRRHASAERARPAARRPRLRLSRLTLRRAGP